MKLPQLSENQLCLGVALDIPEPLATRLREARGCFEDEDAHIPPHITLIPPLALDAAHLPKVRDHLAATIKPRRPFKVHLHSTGSFRPVSPTVFVRVEQGAPDCAALEADVRAGPLTYQAGFDFCPHVTLAHQVDEATLNRALTAMAAFDETFVAKKVDLWQLHLDGNVTHLEHYLMEGSQ